MKVTLIYNCGAGADDQPGEQEIMEFIRDAGHDVHELSLMDAGWGGSGPAAGGSPDRGGAFTRSSMAIEVTVNRHAVEFLAP